MNDLLFTLAKHYFETRPGIKWRKASVFTSNSYQMVYCRHSISALVCAGNRAGKIALRKVRRVPR